jgi:2-methylisocitrate lyase-like PEP mutase family enzyme
MSAEHFRSLHSNSDLLFLANAWDAGSARLIESLGAKAIATTSAGLAWSRGYPDGESLPVDQLLNTARDIARVVRVPLSIDIEGGYSNDVRIVADVVDGVVEIGAGGINIEDGEQPAELLCAKIETARRVASRAGVDLFINARTDVYLRELVPKGAAVREVTRRAKLYRGAGCDGVFVPGVTEIDDIETIARSIDPLPLNIMAIPGLPSAASLRKHGVRRLSSGSAIAQASMALTIRLASDFLGGNSEKLFYAVTEYDAANQLYAAKS